MSYDPPTTVIDPLYGEGQWGNTFIQWKGTDVCIDIHCPKCGAHNHICGDFLYSMQCAKCKSYYKLGTCVTLTELDPADPENKTQIEFAKTDPDFSDDDE